jgi:DedD protein
MPEARMDQALKERIVGAVVIVGLAVVLIPLVLDGPGAPPVVQPAAPDVPAVAEEADGSRTYRYDLETPPTDSDAAVTAPLDAAPAPAELSAARAPVASAATATTAPTPAPVAPAPVTAKPAPVPTTTAKPAAPASVQATQPAAPKGDSAWAAQAGTFSKAATARDLVARLQKLGFKAFVMEVKDGGRNLYRVRIGPVATRADAEALAKRVTQKARLEARPVPHP